MFFSAFPMIAAFAESSKGGETAGLVPHGDIDEGANSREKSFIILCFAEIPAVPTRRRRWGVFYAAAMLIMLVADALDGRLPRRCATER